MSEYVLYGLYMFKEKYKVFFFKDVLKSAIIALNFVSNQKLLIQKLAINWLYCLIRLKSM